MKTPLLIGALCAGLAVSVLPASAVALPQVEGKCLVLPLAPACTAQWDARLQAAGLHFSPIPHAWWTCERAAKGAGHLFDCQTDTK